MGKSVDILKGILETEKELIPKYTEALEVMVHPDSRETVKKILEGKNRLTESIQEILDNSSKCPAVNMTPEAREMMKNYTDAQGTGECSIKPGKAN